MERHPLSFSNLISVLYNFPTGNGEEIFKVSSTKRDKLTKFSARTDGKRLVLPRGGRRGSAIAENVSRSLDGGETLLYNLHYNYITVSPQKEYFRRAPRFGREPAGGDRAMNQNSISDRSNTEELLAEILAQQKKESRYGRIAVLVSLLLVLALAAALITLIPRAAALIDHAQSSLTKIDLLLAQADTLISNANTMITDNTQAVSETVGKLNEVDFAGLNEAIEGLNAAIRPLCELAKLFG